LQETYKVLHLCGRGQSAADPQEGRSDSRRHHNRRDVRDLSDGGTDGPVDRMVEGVTDAVSHQTPEP
jgi:hypothetical protein